MSPNHTLYQLFHKKAGSPLTSQLQHGEFPLNPIAPESSGAVIIVSSRKEAEALRGALYTSEHVYKLTLMEPHKRSLVVALEALPASVKRLSAKQLRLIVQGSREEAIHAICENEHTSIANLQLASIHGIALRTLGEGNARKLTSSERHELQAELPI